jgi:Zn-dependent M28 family amino/carboxypeptidase
MKIRRRLGLAASLLLLAACHPGGEARPVPDIWTLYSGDRAFADVKTLVDLGPRPAASAPLEQARQYIITEVEKAGWKIEKQEFNDDTPRGSIKFCNLIATYGGDPKTQQAIVCSHYDTKLFDAIRFVGASDGGSSTGALIELARTLAHDPGLARRVELVFFDGEEAFVQFTDTDGLYGSRYFARTLRDSGRYKQFKFGILWDMMGPKNLDITLSPDSPADLARGILAAADALTLRQDFTYFDRDIYDDHVPLLHFAEIPTIDLIDFNYPPWHTADDTLDKLGPESLRAVGAVTLYYLRTQFPND